MKFFIFLFFLTINSYSQEYDYNDLIKKSLEYIELKEYSKGRNFAEQAYKINPKRGEAYYCLASIKLQECRNKNQKSCYEGLFFIEKLDGLAHYKKTYFIKGSLLALTNDYENSIKNFTLAIRKEPKNGYYYYNRAYAYLKLGNTSLSCKDLEKSCSLDYPASCKLFSKNCSK